MVPVKKTALFFMLVCCFAFVATDAFSQKKDRKKKKAERKEELTASDTVTFTTSDDFKPTLEINPGAIEEEKKPKKKRRKKKVFYGLKTKVRYFKEIRNNSTIVIKVHVLKEYVAPNPYMRTVSYYSEDKRRPASTTKYKPEYGMPLHGTYERRVNGVLTEKGIYYVGGRHGRWETYGRDQLLRDKKKYYRGFPKDSKITYYDIESTKIKEVIPIQYGKKEGWYLKYYENGKLAVVGQYVDDIKVGTWLEYYNKEGDRGREKKETVYVNRNRPYDEEFEPYVSREWDEKGKKIVDNRKKKRGR
ncbi:hypothetical protein R9C00_29235 [Flammeovirgaceae bacterium SG7u.111]|nr:hypothetical protein [Flammeovirgaceae bacterium SG7u.132]WPO35784.1 hypothetical protein R9C00_29235 [Flammeovirgaceae bacterium SG7u.111]